MGPRSTFLCTMLVLAAALSACGSRLLQPVTSGSGGSSSTASQGGGGASSLHTTTGAGTGGGGGAGGGNAGGGGAAPGDLGPPVEKVVSLHARLQDLRVADVDGDGTLDVVVATQTSLVFFSNDGNEHFSEILTNPYTGNFGGLSVADVDGDGRADLLVASDNFTGPPGGIQFFRNVGGFQFTPPVVLTCDADGAHHASFADANGDGILDVIGGGDAYECVFLGDGHGAFTQVSTVSPPYLTLRSTAIRLFPDPGADLFFEKLEMTGTWDGFVLFRPTGDGHYNEYQSYVLDGSVDFASLDFVDFDGDGLLDAAALDTAGDVKVYLSDGSGGFTTVPGSTPLPSFPGDTRLIPVFGDLDGDGKIDMIGVGPGTVEVWLGNGDGSFQSPRSFPFIEPTCGPGGDTCHRILVRLADMNNDGKPDVVLAIETNVGDDEIDFEVLYNQSP